MIQIRMVALYLSKYVMIDKGEKMKILFADDEIKYRRLVELFLKNQGYKVFTAPDGEALLDLHSKHSDTSLIILDVMMPKLNGIETCQSIRTYSKVPILMLTALGDVHSEIKGLEAGADDYISKPFSNDRLVARVHALIRRQQIIESQTLEVDDLSFDDTSYQVVHGKTMYQLTQKEFCLMKALVSHKGQVLVRESLLNKVWGINYDGDPRTLDTHIKSLRAKLKDLGHKIQTVRGQGYYYRSDENVD